MSNYIEARFVHGAGTADELYPIPGRVKITDLSKDDTDIEVLTPKIADALTARYQTARGIVFTSFSDKPDDLRRGRFPVRTTYVSTYIRFVHPKGDDVSV